MEEIPKISIKPNQCHEDDLAKYVLVHEPGIEALFGSLHASGSLFERPVNLDKARKNHRAFKDAMKRKGVTVYDVRQVLAMECERDLKRRIELENLALEVLKYQVVEKDSVPSMKQSKSTFGKDTEKNELLSNEYKRTCLNAMGVQDLVDIIMTGPTVCLVPSKYNTPFRLDFLSMRPFLNLTFTRDQQIVTNKGLIINRMGSLQRKMETTIMKFCFTKLGLPILGEIIDPGTVEGGDFIAGGSDICFISTGLRTNQKAINQMLENDYFGTRRVCVAHDLFDCDQQRMHLDTVFNIASLNCSVMLDTIQSPKSLIRRLVNEYTKVKGKDGKETYVITKRDVELSEYIQNEGYHIIPVTNEQQEQYGINFLNLGNGYLVAVDESTARTILMNKHFKGSIEVIDYSGMTTMYGSVHCCSQVLLRVKKPEEEKQQKKEEIVYPPKIEVTTGYETPYEELFKSDSNNHIPSNVLIVVPSYFDVSKSELIKTSLITFESDRVIDIKSPLSPKEESDNELSEMEEEDVYSKGNTRGLYIKHQSHKSDMEIIKERKLECSRLHQILQKRRKGINTLIFGQYNNEHTPEAHFPVHVMSTHAATETSSKKNKLIMYPLSSKQRRAEKAKEHIFSHLWDVYEVNNSSELSKYETESKFLEGQASMVFDRAEKNCFIAVKNKPILGKHENDTSFAKHVCEDHLDGSYNLVPFETTDNLFNEDSMYQHINVNMWTNNMIFIGSTFAIVCSQAFKNVEDAEKVKQLLKGKNSRKIIEISLRQSHNFCASGLVELFDNEKKEKVLYVSETAWKSFDEEQSQILSSEVAEVEVINIQTIERTGYRSLGSLISPLHFS